MTSSKKIILLAIYSLFALTLFILLAHEARLYPYFSFDLTFARFIQQFSFSPIPQLMAVISYPGFPPTMIYITGSFILIMIMMRWWKEALIQVNIIWIEQTFAYPTKYSVDRLRPLPNLINVVHVGLEGGKFSFPAGHVLTYVCVFGFVWFVWRRRLKPSWWRTLQLWIIGSLVCLIGISRAYTGEHWASDVIGGYLLGSAVLSANILLFYVLENMTNRYKVLTRATHIGQ